MMVDVAADDPTVATAAAEDAPGAHSQKRRRLRRADVYGLLALAALVVGALASFTAGLWVPTDPNDQELLARLTPPRNLAGGNPDYLLGTDQLGRDVFSRLVHGGRVSFAIGLVTSTLAGIFGTTLGVLAAFRRGLLETSILRLVDVQTAFPFLIVAISIVAVLGASLTTIIFALVIWVWVPFCRLAHAKTLGVKETSYYQAAKSIGRSGPSLVFRHVLPNITPALLVVWTFIVAQTIIAESSMSFLGLGVPLSTPTWGGMLSEGRGYLETAWWIAAFPAVSIVIVVMSVNVLGDWLSDRLDPHAKEY
jgi:peptide/nickel transport system permease protein